MEQQIKELLKYVNQDMEKKGRPITLYRYIPKASDLDGLSLIKTEKELRMIAKDANAQGYLAMAEMGGRSYKLTFMGQHLALYE